MLSHLSTTSGSCFHASKNSRSITLRSSESLSASAYTAAALSVMLRAARNCASAAARAPSASAAHSIASERARYARLATLAASGL